MGVTMMDDMELVRQYAQSKSEEAFATLVSRHVNLVYSIALRHVGDAAMAEEIAQTVFIVLSRKAGSLGPKMIVSGWLCRTARFVSARAMVMQRRRRQREQEAYMQTALDDSDNNTWTAIAPLLDAAMEQLGEKDHSALVLRFFEGRSFKGVSEAIGTSEAGAKMRVNRALDKLRQYFTKRGLLFSASAIAGALSAHSIQAAPLGLAASITGAAVKGATLTASTVNLIDTTIKLMAWTKLKIAVVAGAVVLLAGGAASVAVRRAHTTSSTSTLSFAGYATPEAALQSLIWLCSKGDYDQFMANMTPEAREWFTGRMQGKSSEQLKQEGIAMANAMVGYKITQIEKISADEVHVHIHATPSNEGLRSGKANIIMKKIGNEWKHGGDVH